MARTASLRSALALAVVLVVAAAPASAKDTAAEEAKLKSQVAAEIVKAADACTAGGAKTGAESLLAEAEALDPKAAGLDEAKIALEALEADAADAEARAQKARAAAKSRIAPLFDKLGALDHAPADDGRFLDYTMRAFQWDPKPRTSTLLKRAKAALESDAPWTGARLLARIRKADPEGTQTGKYDAADIDLAKSNKLMLASADGQVLAWVSFPKDWSRTKKLPIAVGVEGAGCGFQGYFNGLVGSRGSRSVICVTPISTSNTNADNINPKTYPMYDPAWLESVKNDVVKRMEVEGPGMEAILADLHERFGADEKVFHTGFSGGGIYTYWRLFQHPDKVRGAAPACGNFGGLGLQGAPGVTDGGPPVFLMMGEKDPHREFTHGDKNQPGIEPQTNMAAENLEKLGYTHVVKHVFPGVGHSSLHGEFWKFVDDVQDGK